MTDPVSYGRRLTVLAEERGEETAVVFAADDGTDHELSWLELERRSNQTARRLSRAGVSEGDVVVVALRNSEEHLFSTFGVWKLGASVLPLRAELPVWERDRIFEVAAAQVVIGEWDDEPRVTLKSADVVESSVLDGTPLDADHVPEYARLIATSGSTGTPKIILTPAPGVYRGPVGLAAALPARAIVMVTSPLYHTNGFAFCYPTLLDGNRVVLMEHFEAARAVGLIERHRVQLTVLVPTMLQRIARLDDIGERDLSSLETVIYGGATIPEWLVRTWLELVPPERFVFTYGGSEMVGLCMCTGSEWLEHPGTTGRPVGCDVLILNADRETQPAGEVGEIWMRLHSEGQPFRYLGTETPEPVLDGYRTFGDMGWVDDDGYVYIADRRQDMIVTGGANVFPAEVEAALSEHRQVLDVVVVGVPDPEWGHRVHAIVQPADPRDPPDVDELRAHCKARLSGPKVPKTFEILDLLPRTAAGKINRSKLVDERTAGS
jgi:bile acid-coenzyme A ligase